MEKIAERLLELLKTDVELRAAVLELINQAADAKRALAEQRRSRARARNVRKALEGP